MTAAAVPGHRLQRALRPAVAAEWFTIGWMLVEAAVALVAGVAAGSIALTGFGIDSVIELAAAFLVLRRLLHYRRSGSADEATERRVLRYIAYGFFALAAYVVIDGLIALLSRSHPEHSPAGLVLTLSALIVMPALGLWKRRIATTAEPLTEIGRFAAGLLRADAAETLLCAALSLATALGLLLDLTLSWWWADPLAGFVIAIFAIREGREALGGELFCQD
jgi:divalent metal cation (Fe/Co/Zn/Cd) transporter